MVKVYNNMTYEDARILVRLRTGHSGLNCHLYKIGRTESAGCVCGTGEKTVAHFLFLCPQWIGLRQHLRSALMDRWADLSYALGGWSDKKDRTRKLIDGRSDRWRPNTRVLKAVVQFVKETGRFQPKATEHSEQGD
jgi:hypothetical protein